MQYNYVDWSIRKKPYPLIMEAINHFKHINGKTIVEVGSMRLPAKHDINNYDNECCMEGHSSLLFALNSDEFHTVDIDMPTSRIAYNSLKEANLKTNWNVYNGDGIKFLTDFVGIIDLLFLDAWDIGVQGYAESHLEAYKAAELKLNKQHIILIDDTDIGWSEERGLHNDEECMGGKGRLLIPHLISKGYTVLFKGRQTCLINIL